LDILVESKHLFQSFFLLLKILKIVLFFLIVVVFLLIIIWLFSWMLVIGILFLNLYLLISIILLLLLLLLLSLCIHINIHFSSDKLISENNSMLIALYPRSVWTTLNWCHIQLFYYFVINIELYWRSVHCRKAKGKFKSSSIIILNIWEDWT
jgi:hypothetical protein